MNIKVEQSGVNVLLIEDNPGDVKLIMELLKNYVTEFYVKSCHSIKEAKEYLAVQKFDAVILDLSLPDSSGFNSILAVKEMNDSIPIIVLTSDNSERTGLASIDFGAQDFLIKNGLEQSTLIKSIQYSISRKNLELKVKESAALNETVFDQAAIGIMHLAVDSSITKINTKLCKMLGYTKKELLGIPISSITHPDDIENDLVNLENLINGRAKSYLFEKRFVHKNGSVIWAEITRSAVYDNKGEVFSFFTTVNDITEKKMLQMELERQQNFLNKIFDVIPVGLWIADGSGNIIRNNRAGEEIWQGAKYVGVDSLREYKGWWADSGKKLENEDWAIYRAVNKGETSLGEIINIECFDGTRKTIINSAVPLFNENKVTGVVVVNQDITKLIEYEKQLQNSVEEKEMLMRESHHRIKNNLQLIISLLNLSVSSIRDQESKNILLESSSRLRSISNLHDYMHSMGQYESVNIADYLNKLLDYSEAAIFIKNKNIEIEKDFENFKVGSRIAVSIGLILNELVTNAVKYAFNERDNGKIEIVVKKVNEFLSIKFKDNGVGIPDAALNSSDSLGMTIIDAMVDQHNGDIKTNINGGTEFIITMPLK